MNLSCGFTQDVLNEAINQAVNAAAAAHVDPLDYLNLRFFKNKDASAPHSVRSDIAAAVLRCLECGHTIGEHTTSLSLAKLHAAEIAQKKVFHCVGTLKNFRVLGRYRAQVISRARSQGARGTIEPHVDDDTNSRKDLFVDLHFDGLEKANMFVDFVAEMADVNKLNRLASTLNVEEIDLQGPARSPLPNYRHMDDSLETDYSSHVSITSNIARLPSDSINLTVSESGEVVHLVPRALLKTFGDDIKNVHIPWALIGGPHILNVMTDQKIPTARRTVVGNEDFAHLTIECKGKTDFCDLRATLIDHEDVAATKSGFFAVQFHLRIPYFDQFAEVLKWRESCVVKAAEDPPTVATSNGKNKFRRWFEQVDLPASIQDWIAKEDSPSE